MTDHEIHQLITRIDELPRCNLDGTWYRYHNPAWAWSPYAGTGAKLIGGRFNPKGIQALYLADSPETALREVTTGAGPRLIQPWLLCSYHVCMSNVLDLTQHKALFDTPWRLDLLQQLTPPGWQLCNYLKQHSNITGLLVPSFQGEGNNLVLLRYRQVELQVFDPENRLTKAFGHKLDQSPWG